MPRFSSSFDEAKFKAMEETRPDEMEMAAKKNEET